MKVHVVVVGAAANGLSRQLEEVYDIFSRDEPWSESCPFRPLARSDCQANRATSSVLTPFSQPLQAATNRLGNGTAVTAGIVDSEDFLSALNFSARDQRKSLPLVCSGWTPSAPM
ncbi:hypothetical protein FOZ63_015981 [Perkinsus olseni]|uniref:Uncharacterized protein n=1 Tax=Perkinsus olseni TaxID=32597 RepID=A0A7J6U869_PEROL|nr:hypothetical protein FOZ63_015981 [Perkinsus olseni]